MKCYFSSFVCLSLLTSIQAWAGDSKTSATTFDFTHCKYEPQMSLEQRKKQITLLKKWMTELNDVVLKELWIVPTISPPLDTPHIKVPSRLNGNDLGFLDFEKSHHFLKLLSKPISMVPTACGAPYRMLAVGTRSALSPQWKVEMAFFNDDLLVRVQYLEHDDKDFEIIELLYDKETTEWIKRHMVKLGK